MIFDSLRSLGAKSRTDRSEPLPANPVDTYDFSDVEGYVAYHNAEDTEAAGYPVSEHTALKLGIVRICTRVVNESLAILPVYVRESSYEGDRPVHYRRPDHVVSKLLQRPNPEQTAYYFKVLQSTFVQLWGNAYAEIERNALGEPVALWPLEPWRVTPTRDAAGQLVYRVSNNQKGDTVLRPEDMWHLRGPYTLDGITGLSCIAVARLDLGITGSMQKYQASFYANGGIPSVAIAHKEGGVMKKIENKAAFYRDWDERIRGPNKAGRMIYLEPGLSPTPISIPFEDVEFLESRKMQINEICRLFRVHPHKAMAMEDMSYNNLENLRLESTTDTVQPWVQNWKEETEFKLFSRGSKFGIFFDMKELMRGDYKTMAEWQKARFMSASLVPNDIREWNGENPIPNGDVPFVPVNMQPLDMAVKEGPKALQPGQGDGDDESTTE